MCATWPTLPVSEWPSHRGSRPGQRPIRWRSRRGPRRPEDTSSVLWAALRRAWTCERLNLIRANWPTKLTELMVVAQYLFQWGTPSLDSVAPGHVTTANFIRFNNDELEDLPNATVLKPGKQMRYPPRLVSSSKTPSA